MNERLRDAMTLAHIDIDTLSKNLSVDPKTVQRWLNGRIPHPRHRWKVAELLNEREDFLWSTGKHTIEKEHTSEIVAAYAHRADVQPKIWLQLFSRAKKTIDLLAYAMLFIPEQNPGLVTLFQEKAKGGCRIRIALADPACVAVRMRDEEEQLEGTLPARIQTTLHHFRNLRNHTGIEIRLHSTVMYNSLFRCDNEMFVTPHLYGLHGSKAPLLHLRYLETNGIFANFAAHFEAIWATARLLDKGGSCDSH